MAKQKNIERALERAKAEGLFSAYALGVFDTQSTEALFYGGSHLREDPSEKVDEKSFFDLASLTKVLGTASYLLSSRALTELPSDLIGLMTRTGNVSCDLCLSAIFKHSSGLPEHIKLHEVFPKHKVLSSRQQRTESHVLDYICALTPQYLPGHETLYSDLGFIAFALSLEQWMQHDWCSLIETELSNRWDQADLVYTPLEKGISQSRIVATQWDDHAKLKGVVHDPNTQFLGGASSHAGLFGTLEACLNMGKKWLRLMLGRGHLSRSPQASVFWKSSEKERPWAWDRPTFPNCSGGENISTSAIGHLGYTGTSIWLDPEREKGVVLLTNRVHPKDEHLAEMKTLRTHIHNLIW